MKQKRRRWAVIMIPVIAIAGFTLWRTFGRRSMQASGNVLMQRTTVAERGVLEVTLTGSGSVSPAIRKNIKVETDGVIKEVSMQEGQAVKAGDVLITLVQQDTRLTSERLQNTLRQRELAYRKELDKRNDFTVTAPIKGEITSLLVKEGDEVTSGAVLMTITDTSKLNASLRFENAQIEQFQASHSTFLHLPEFRTTLTAEIVSLEQAQGSVIASVVVDNPGALKEGVAAWCEVETPEGSLKSATGTLIWHGQETIRAKASGSVLTLAAGENQIVSAGSVLISLYDESYAINLENARLQMEEARQNLEQSQVDADKYVVTAPMDGHIVSVAELFEGESIREGTTIAIFLGMTEMEFKVNIDELDINRVKPGQRVMVTADAIEGSAQRPIIGRVKTVALEGSTQNAVTSYPVTIVVPGVDGLRAGMNVNAKIEVVRSDNTLMVPLEALQKRGDAYMVWLRRDTEAAENTGATTPQAGGQGTRRGADFENRTDEEREALRERMASGEGRQRQTGGVQGIGNLSEEERTALRQRLEGIASGQASDEASSTRRSTGHTSGAVSFTAVTSYYEGGELVEVETGIYNETWIEIKSGLQEGDIVILPQQATGSASGASQQSQLPFGLNMGNFSNQFVPGQGARR